MADKKISAFGIYRSLVQAERGADALVHGNFLERRHLCARAGSPGHQRLRSRAAHQGAGRRDDRRGAGGALGGTLGLLAGVGALAIPGLGPFIAAGPIIGALAGRGVGGAAGGLVGALVGMGIPEHEAKRYEGRVKDGGVLLSVHCATSDEVARAKKILEQTGAEDIASSGEKTGEQYATVVPDRNRL